MIHFVYRLTLRPPIRRCAASAVLSLALPLGLFPAVVPAHDTGHGSVEATASERVVTKGGRTDIDLLALCRARVASCAGDTLRIVTPPLEGALFNQTGNSLLNYQHAGTSDQDDRFTFTAETDDGETIGPIEVVIDVRSSDARLEVLAPQPGQQLTGKALDVAWRFEGRDVDHVHLSLGGDEHVSLYAPAGTHRFDALEPGRYVLEASLATADHSAIPGTATAIPFTILPDQ